MPSAPRAVSSRRKPPLRVEALWAIKRIGAPTLSPDGGARLRRGDELRHGEERQHDELWLFPTGQPTGMPRTAARARRLTAGDKDSDPKWSPDGRWIAFTAKRKDDDEPQVYLIAPDGGEARRLTRLATGASALKWFPDGKRIAFISWVWPDLATDAAQAKRRKERKDAKVKAHVTERDEFRFWDHWLTDGREPHVFVCDVATGRCRDALAGTGLALPPWEPSADDYDIAPDGREIAITADLGARAADDEPDATSSRVDLAYAAEARADRGHENRRRAAALLARRALRSRSIAYDTQRAFNDQGHLMLLERSERHGCGALAPEFDRATTHVAWTPDSARSLHRRRSRPRRHVRGCRCRRGGAGARRRGRHGRRLRAIARRRGARVRPRDAPSSRPRCSRAAPTAARERRIETVNRALLARHAIGEVREVTVKGWGGEPVQMFVTYPPNFDPKKKWPLLHSIHGGPHAAHHRRLALPLEHAGLRRARLRRRRGQLSRLVRLRPEVARDDHRPIRREGVRRRRGRRPTGCCARATSTARGSPRPAAATAATWWRA